jgi:hypothetical protein
MALHDRRGASALVIGSEIQKVLTHSTIPVRELRARAGAQSELTLPVDRIGVTERRAAIPTNSAPGLKRSLSLGHATLYGLGVTVGAGICVLIGAATAHSAMSAPPPLRSPRFSWP